MSRGMPRGTVASMVEETPLYQKPAPDHFDLDTFLISDLEKNPKRVKRALNQRYADGWQLVSTIPSDLRAGIAPTVSPKVTFVWERAQ